MKKFNLLDRMKYTATVVGSVFISLSSYAQTNVYDDVIATSSNHTYLATALSQEGLDVVLQDSNATYTVFAPDNMAFDNLAAALNTDINGLLALPNLSDVLTYHVLGVTVPASGVTNGAIVQPLSMTNTLKLTLTSNSDVFVNQAQVTTADLNTDNGTVHVINAIVLPYETVVDVAIDNGFTSLTAAVVKAELLPALTDPLAKLTVFAPNNAAFDDLAAALNTDINGILALPNLADVLTYHVLGSEVPSSGVTNGAIVQPLSATNTLKLTVTGNSEVFVNQAQVILADVTAYNGVVHVLDAAVLPFETVADVAIDNGFTTLTTAVVKAELLPALTNPFATLTVFAPDNAAFDDLAAALNTDINGLLNLPELGDILTYHVVGQTLLAADLTDGPLATLNGANLNVATQNGVTLNGTDVTIADLLAFNGVVHVVDEVLIASSTGIESYDAVNISTYPNPASDFITIETPDAIFTSATIIDFQGRQVKSFTLNGTRNMINTSDIPSGSYLLLFNGQQTQLTKKIQIVTAN